MALLPIVAYPDPLLRAHAAKVDKVDLCIKKLIDDMFETMYADRGVGLAAPQVGSLKRIAVIDISSTGDQPLCLINPIIMVAQGSYASEEGCLSLPGIFAKVSRAREINLSYQDQQGRHQQQTFNDFLAACIQHELDHLNGKLFVDRLSTLKKAVIQRKLRKKTLAYMRD